MNKLVHSFFLLAIILSSAAVNAQCLPPDLLSTNDISGTKAAIGWQPQANALAYKISYRLIGSSTWNTETVHLPATGKIITGLESSTAYEWRVKTICADGRSPWSEAVQFSTADLCRPVNGIAISNITDTTVLASWFPTENVIDYKLRYREDGTTTWTSRSITAPTIARQIINLTPSTLYQYRIDATCTSGDKVLGEISTFTTTGGSSSGKKPADEVAETKPFTYNLYPNPNSGQFTLKAEGELYGDAVINMHDLTGRILIKRTWNTATESTLNLNTDLSSGVYLITIEANGHRFNERLIIQN